MSLLTGNIHKSSSFKHLIYKFKTTERKINIFLIETVIKNLESFSMRKNS